jgi:multicomponent Na+:H+ antiporter subunit D
MGLTVLLYSFGNVDRAREHWGYYPVLQFLLMGINGSFLTGDLFNLFVFFEVMLMASYVLLALGGEPSQLQESFKYLVLNLLASTVFVASVGILYGVTGTLNMADLSQKMAHTDRSGLITALAMLFLFVFGVKAAIFPLFFWLPDAYPQPPAAVSALFAGLLTKVGVYTLLRTFTLLFVQDIAFTHTLILVLAAFTMIVGVLGAIVQNHLRGILSFHIISQIGYMILGLGLFTPLALAGSIFYIIHHIIVKTALFLISGVTGRITGTDELKNMGGLLTHYPWLSALFLLAALS